MAIPTTIESLSVTPASNGPAGSDDRSTADDGLRQAYAFIKQTVSLGANIASASTITPPSTGSVFNITGVTTITTIASTNSWDGRLVTFIFAGALTLTHSSNLALPGSANITTAANDIATFVQTASGAWRCVLYQSAALTSGYYLPLIGGTVTGAITGPSFIPNGASVPANGMYLSAANTLALASNTTLRWSVNSTGNHTFAAPSSGTTLALTQGVGLTAFSATDGTVTTRVFLDSGVAFAGNLSNHSYRIQTNGTERFAIAAGGNVTIAAPSSGVALAINGVSTNNVVTLNVPAATTANAWSATNGTVTMSGLLDNSNNAYLRTDTAHSLILGTNNAVRQTINSVGNVTIAAPSSGATLALTQIANTAGVTLTDGTRTFNIGTDTGGGSVYLGAVSGHNFDLYAGNANRVRIGSAGNVTIAAPSSGDSLVVTSVANGVALRTSDGTIGMAAFTAASTNAYFGTSTNHPFSIVANSTAAINISTARAISIPAPSSGTALTVTAVAGALAADFTAGPIKTRATTVASLLAAATAGAGARDFVTDANATTFASIVAGGGANGVPVYSDGTNWRIG
jgi:hypothetical protein